MVDLAVELEIRVVSRQHSRGIILVPL
jgi:hypothetical protein